ncbi:MAG: hypothetical protein IJM97_05715 [Clostridia bacterium]|nr:hypothetical protein [Clostridia bacterium]
MSKKFKKIISAILTLLILSSCFVFASAEEHEEILIINPYEDVIWKGENAWRGYKGSLHTHSTYSDADVTLREMVMEYYKQGYGFLAMADHSVTGVEWNKAPNEFFIYKYQLLLGNKQEHLTDEEYEAVINGTYPMPEGETRDFGLTCITGANELNGLTLTKSHVVAYGLDYNVGTGHAGKENGFRSAVEFAENNGGFSVIAHPGDWLESRDNMSAIYDEKNIKLFSEIFLDHDTCLGMEIFNEDNGVTPYDRNLWDNILMETLPHGRLVLGFSNSDAHTLEKVDSSFAVFMMPDNSAEQVNKTMHSGNFFAVTRKVHKNEVLGPDVTYNVIDRKLPVPMATNVEVDGAKITMEVENADFVQWVANGKVIAKTIVDGTGTSVLDLNEIEGSEDFLYVRAEISGEGGLAASQPFVIEKETEEYKKDTSFLSWLEDFFFTIKSTRLYVVIQELIRAIA